MTRKSWVRLFSLMKFICTKVRSSIKTGWKVSRAAKQTISHAEIAQRSCSACLIAHTAMKLGRKLKWDPKKEEYIGDKEANATLSRPQRGPYGTTYVKGESAYLIAETFPEAKSFGNLLLLDRTSAPYQ